MRNRLFTESDIEQIRSIIANNPTASRKVLAREVCSALQWYQLDGNPKQMGCVAAMLTMHREGIITMPPARPVHKNFKKTPKPLRTERGAPRDELVEPVHRLLPITLERVTPGDTSKLWNEYIDRYHYLGFGVLKGAQLRYLIHSSKGPVGAIGFASPAWKTRDRDAWIGWDQDTRTHNLHYIVSNTRFLILPWVKSKNLASKILSLCAQQLPKDWEERYGYRPVLLETFVEQKRFTGTCYKAANWIRVGQTTGRGKWEQKGENKVRAPLAIKDIFIYPLQRNYKAVLNQNSHRPMTTPLC